MLVELRAEVLHDDLERLGRYDPARVPQRMRDAFEPANTRVIVVAGADVGSITARQNAYERWIEHFYLATAIQGQGVGGRVLRMVLAEDRLRPVRLNVLQGSPARRLYERNGFVVYAQDEVDVFMTLAPLSSAAAQDLQQR